MYLYDDLYWFHEIVDELCYKEVTTLEATNKYIGWMVNVNDGLIWPRFIIQTTVLIEGVMNCLWNKYKLRRRRLTSEERCLNWLHKHSSDYDYIKNPKFLSYVVDIKIKSNSVSIIPSLSCLVYLKTLTLHSKHIQNIESLSNLHNLVKLDLSNTGITDVSPLSNLVKLNTLNLSNTKIIDLEPLVYLTNLQGLKICNTPVKEIPSALFQISIFEFKDISSFYINYKTYMETKEAKKKAARIAAYNSCRHRVYWDHS